LQEFLFQVSLRMMLSTMKFMRRNLMGCLLAPILLVAAGVAQAASVKVYAFHAGILKTQTQYLLKDTRVGTPMDIPVPFLVIQHGKEWVAFDTGCNAQAANNPAGYWGEAIAKAYTPVIKPDQEFREAIKLLGLAPSDFKALVISHGHIDHAGAIDNFLGTRVPIYFQKAEMHEVRKVVVSKLFRNVPLLTHERMSPSLLVVSALFPPGWGCGT